MKKEWGFVILLFLLFFIPRIALFFLSPVKYWDETIYVNLGRNILTYHEYSFLHGFGDFSPDWPLAGNRPPLLPLIVAGVSIFTSNVTVLGIILILINFAGIFTFFFLSKEFFNEKTAVISSIIISLIPISVFWGSKILTDQLLLTFSVLSVYFFWMIFFKNKHGVIFSVFFGFFSALGFLSKYSMVWFFPMFFVALLFKYRNFKFFREKSLWISVLVFFIIVGPWFFYNYFLYGSWFGFLVQADVYLNRWGTQPFYFYFVSIIKNYWYLLLFFLIGTFYPSRKYREQKIFLILWFLVIIFLASMTGHKEDRYLLPVLPAFVLISAFGLSRFKKKYFYFLMFGIVFLMLFYNFFNFLHAYRNYNSDEQNCFFNSMEFIGNSSAEAVVTEYFSPVYFYTRVNNIRVSNYSEIKNIIENDFSGREVYYFYVNGDWFDLVRENPDLKKRLIYSCSKYNVYNLSLD